MEPLKKVQVEGYVMFAEPEVLFGNLDELCCVSSNVYQHKDQDITMSIVRHTCFWQESKYF